MSENANGKASKLKIAIISAASAVVVAGAATAAVLLLNSGDKVPTEDGTPAITIGMEQNGVVALNEEDLAGIYAEMERHASAGMMDLSYKNIAVSYDGVNFACDFGNPASNPYYMYFNIYTDATFEEQLLLTGLVPPGMQLENFVSEIPLDPGEYESVLVFTQIEDDRATICGQSSVVLHLVVYDGEPEIEEVE